MSADAGRLVDQLVAAFREQVQRALGIDLDASVTSLAFVDHHLQVAREALDEDEGAVRGAPIWQLVAAGAGAYFGEIVRREMGAHWIGDGRDPRRLRLLLEPQFLHFSPIDQAYEALLGEALADDDPRLPEGAPIDTAFRARTRPRPAPNPVAGAASPPADAAWLEEELARVPPVSAAHYFSLTARYETLELILSLLAAKHSAEGRAPNRLTVADYAAELVDPGPASSEGA